NELNQEIDALLPKVKLRKKAKRTQSEGIVLANTNAQAADVNNENTNINDNKSSAGAATSTNVNVQVTETQATNVEATPLTESRLDRLKKNRLEMERSTEEKIVEKLEADRIEREKKRAAKTESLTFEEQQALKDAEKSVEINQYQSKDTTTITPIQAQDSVVVVPQKSQTVEVAPVKVESTIQEDFSKVEVKKEEPGVTRWFVGGNAGLSDYSAQNVKGVYAAGVTFGVELPERIIIEGGILFSSYDVVAQPTGYYINGVQDIYYRTIQLEQRNYTVGAKYQFTKTRVRPVAGVLVSYTTRTFEDALIQRPSSQGYDAGLTLGADIAISDNFSLGADLRYFMNLSSRREQSSYSNGWGYGYTTGYGPYPGVQDGKAVDEINYYVLGINGVIRF
ncbi:MAG TPA: hypothetical protein VFV50_00255, partial [Bdellovibrionales bacterium]|nr:hypothetical protein [Bdellovibrionales bacterium]